MQFERSGGDLAPASPAWARLLDAVADGEIRLHLSGGSGHTAVMISENELVALEEQARRSRSPHVVLTPRERQVLLHVESRRSALDIASELGLALGTVVQHLASARRKYRVRTSLEAAVRARDTGALD